MSQDRVEQMIEVEQSTRKEYNIAIEGVIEIPESVQSDAFFDGLLDILLEYVEKYEGRAAVTVTHSEYIDTDGDSSAIKITLPAIRGAFD
jgi:hypothetical protein